jgi:hypothetical protein
MYVPLKQIPFKLRRLMSNLDLKNQREKSSLDPRYKCMERKKRQPQFAMPVVTNQQRNRITKKKKRKLIARKNRQLLESQSVTYIAPPEPAQDAIDDGLTSEQRTLRDLYRQSKMTPVEREEKKRQDLMRLYQAGRKTASSSMVPFDTTTNQAVFTAPRTERQRPTSVDVVDENKRKDQARRKARQTIKEKTDAFINSTNGRNLVNKLLNKVKETGKFTQASLTNVWRKQIQSSTYEKLKIYEKNEVKKTVADIIRDMRANMNRERKTQKQQDVQERQRTERERIRKKKQTQREKEQKIQGRNDVVSIQLQFLTEFLKQGVSDSTDLRNLDPESGDLGPRAAYSYLKGLGLVLSKRQIMEALEDRRMKIKQREGKLTLFEFLFLSKIQLLNLTPTQGLRKLKNVARNIQKLLGLNPTMLFLSIKRRKGMTRRQIRAETRRTVKNMSKKDKRDLNALKNKHNSLSKRRNFDWIKSDRRQVLVDWANQNNVPVERPEVLRTDTGDETAERVVYDPGYDPLGDEDAAMLEDDEVEDDEEPVTVAQLTAEEQEAVTRREVAGRSDFTGDRTLPEGFYNVYGIPQ